MVVGAVEQEQCGGGAPMESVSSFLDMQLDYDLADRICCHNHVYAEPSGYHATEGVNLYNKLDPTKETVFYDSVCGIPLFVAPRDRSFEEFVQESLKHGWPSFRPAELVSENVIIHPGGRMESKCGTHLGHNLPEGGVDRYCIDLVCVAGTPGDDANVFDAVTYKSSAELWSGKYPKTKERIIMAASVLLPLIVVGLALSIFYKKYQNKYMSNQASMMTKELSSNLSFDSDEEVEEHGRSNNRNEKGQFL